MYSKFKPDIEIVGNIKEYLKKFIEFISNNKLLIEYKNI